MTEPATRSQMVDQLEFMPDAKELARATKQILAISDPQMFAALMLAKRLIEDHAHELAREAFDAEGG